MRRGYYLAHELEAAVRRYLRHHNVPLAEQAAVSSRLVYLNWKAAREKNVGTETNTTPHVQTPDQGGVGEDVSRLREDAGQHSER